MLVALAAKDGSDISRIYLFLGAGFSALFLSIERVLLARLVQRKLGSRFMRHLLVIDGVPISAPPGYEVVDVAEHGVTPDPNGPHALHAISGLLSGADRVLLSSVPERRENWSLYLKGIGCNGELLLPDFRALGQLQAVDAKRWSDCPFRPGRSMSTAGSRNGPSTWRSPFPRSSSLPPYCCW